MIRHCSSVHLPLLFGRVHSFHSRSSIVLHECSPLCLRVEGMIVSFLHWFLSSGKVQEEIEQVIGSNPPRIEHRTQMPYTDAVIHEVQRFANILPLDLPHETAEDVTLKDYFIPKVRCSWDCFC